MKKRVWTLYRVSTKKQVGTDDDIPMQRKACRKFISEQNDWELTNELSELGVSGWKNSTDDRDALVKIKQAAENGEFDILLVFMADRLGRKQDETPLVVDFLHNNGVEVWSVKEGLIKVENHIDKLMTYISFWQSSGESLKTSIRVKEIMDQMNEEGLYVGGGSSFGYEVYETDTPHPKKDKKMKSIRINEKERHIAKLIFDLVVQKGYGAGRIAKYLNEEGYENRNGKVWRNNTILRMLRNPIYMGRKRYNYKNKNDKRKLNDKDEWRLQPKDESLAIIDEATFYKVQEIMDSRNNNKESTATVPTKSKLLLSGIAFCGYCGCKLSADYSTKKYKRKTDGQITVTQQYRYSCSHAKNIKHPKRHFAAKLYESEVEDRIVNFFSEEFKLDEFIKEQENFRKKNVIEKEKVIGQLKNAMENKYRQLDKLNDELVNVLMGESKFTEEQLSRALQKVENEISEMREKIDTHEIELRESALEVEDAQKMVDGYSTWLDEYQSADFDTQKMMLSGLLNKVVFRDKEIEIEFKLIIERSMDSRVWKDENLVNTVAYNESTSNSQRGRNTLPKLLEEYLARRNLKHLSFSVEVKIA